MEGATVPLKMSDFTYVVEDMAGNITYTPVTKLLEGHSNKPEQDGSDQAPDKNQKLNQNKTVQVKHQTKTRS